MIATTISSSMRVNAFFIGFGKSPERIIACDRPGTAAVRGADSGERPETRPQTAIRDRFAVAAWNDPSFNRGCQAPVTMPDEFFRGARGRPPAAVSRITRGLRHFGTAESGHPETPSARRPCDNRRGPRQRQLDGPGRRGNPGGPRRPRRGVASRLRRGRGFRVVEPFDAARAAGEDPHGPPPGNAREAHRKDSRNGRITLPRQNQP